MGACWQGSPRELAIQTLEALIAFLGQKLWWASVTQVENPCLYYKCRFEMLLIGSCQKRTQQH